MPERHTELMRLAALCEAASDEVCTVRLNGDILRALGWTSDDRNVYDPDGNSRSGVPSYTASLDAAVTLVPDGCDWCLGVGTDEPANAAISPAMKVTEWHADAATPALALCAAALRAMAAQEDSNHG